MTQNIVRLSTDLQIDLVRKLAERVDQRRMMDQVVEKAIEVLKADAAAIYVEDRPPRSADERTATMQAARGYQRYAVGTAWCQIVDPRAVSPHPSAEEKLGLTSWVLSTGKALLATSPEDVIRHPHWSGRFDRAQVNQMPSRDELILAAFLAVPFRDLQGHVIGVIKAERLQRPGAEPFSPQDQIALEALARVARRCIAYLHEVEKGNQDDAIMEWTLNVIDESVAGEGDLDAFLDSMVRVTAAATQADSCAVFLIDEIRQTLTQRAGCGNQALRKVIRSYKLPGKEQVLRCYDSQNNSLVHESCDPPHCPARSQLKPEQRVGLTAWVAATGKSFYANNYEGLKLHCHHRGQFDDQNYEGRQRCGAWLGVPLRVGGLITGVVKIENVSETGVPDSRTFSTEIRQRFDVLTQEIALAIERFQQQSQARYEVMHRAMPTILEILRGGRDIPLLVKHVVEKTAELFDARACALFLTEGNQLIQPEWAAVGWATAGPSVRRYDLVPPEQIPDLPTDPTEKVGLTVWLAVKKKPFTAKSNLELVSHPHHRGEFDIHNFKPGERCETFMGVPLLSGENEELIGVLKVETKRRKAGSDWDFAYFNEQDELVFRLIANSAAIAIQNARLLESRRLSENILRHCHSTSDVLKELCTFFRGRIDVLSTLETAAQSVGAEAPEKRRVLDIFTRLQHPKWRVELLRDLAELQSDASAGSLLALYAEARAVTSLETLRELHQTRAFNQVTVSRADLPPFFLHQSAELFLRTFDSVRRSLEQYQDGEVQLLNAGLDELQAADDATKSLDLFEQGMLREIFECWRSLIAAEAKHWHRIRNPYVAGRPLEADSTVFVGREDVFRWIADKLRNPSERHVLILHGGFHTGKTSILKQLASGFNGIRLRRRKPHPLVPIYVDLQRLADPGTGMFLLGLAEAIQTRLSETANEASVPTPSEEEFRRAHYRAFDLYLSSITPLLSSDSDALLVLMLDEFELLDDRVQAGKIDADIFAYLRSLMQHQSHVGFILAGRHRLDEMQTAFKDPIFNVATHKELAFLTDGEARLLIKGPVEVYGVQYDSEVVEEVQRLSGGHPFFIQQLCQQCIDCLNEEQLARTVRRDHLQKSLERSLARNPVLDSLWKLEILADDRAVLRALARLSPAVSAGVRMAEVCRHLGWDEPQVSQSLDRLVSQQFLARVAEATVTGQARGLAYQFQIDMLRLWVLRNCLHIDAGAVGRDARRTPEREPGTGTAGSATN